MSVSNVPVSKMARRAGLRVSWRLLGARLHDLLRVRSECALRALDWARFTRPFFLKRAGDRDPKQRVRGRGA